MKKIFLLIIITLLAFVVRFYNLTTSPGGLYIDETSIGYNAYSLIETGKDEHGKAWPLFFEAFGEWKLPVYIYSVVIAQLFLGPTDASVRIPAVLFGTFSIPLMYFFVMLLLKDVWVLPGFYPKNRIQLPANSGGASTERSFGIPKSGHPRELIALLAAFLLAISPWHYLFSRPGHEATAALFFEIMGLWLFFKAVRSGKEIGGNRKVRVFELILSVFAFVATLYTYNSARIVTPLILVCLIVLYRKSFSLLQWVFAGLIGLCVVIPFMQFALSPAGFIRAQQVSVFFQPQQEPVWHVIAGNYWKNISPETLFIKGDIYDKAPYEMGLLHLVELPFFFLGLGYLILVFRDQIKRKVSILLLVLFAVGFIPAAISWPNPLALRTLLVLPATISFSALGMGLFISKLKYKQLKILSILGYLVLFTVSELYFLYQYHQGYVISAGERVWQIGQKRALLANEKYQLFGKTIYLNSTIRTINAAWFLRFEPNLYRKNIYVNQYGIKYVFVDSVQQLPEDALEVIYIGPEEFIPKAQKLETITSLSSQFAYAVWLMP